VAAGTLQRGKDLLLTSWCESRDEQSIQGFVRLQTDNGGDPLSPPGSPFAASDFCLSGIAFKPEIPRPEWIFALLAVGTRWQAALGVGCCQRYHRTFRAEILPRRIQAPVGSNDSKKRKRRPCGVPSSAPSRITIEPRDMVATGQPVVSIPSYGVQPQRDAIQRFSMRRFAFKSTMVKSAS